MLVVVAGGTGLLGSLVADRLVDQGHQVRALSRGLSPHTGPHDPRVERVRGDVRDAAMLTTPLAGADVVVSAVQGFLGPDGVTPASVDRDGNRNLIDAAAREGADVVLVSMTGASADSPMELARMKAAAEEHLRGAGVPWTVVRGAGFAQAWMDIVQGTADARGRLTVFGRADNPIPWVDVREVAELVVRSVTDRALRGEILELCGPESWTLGRLAAELMAARGVAGRPRRIPRPALHVMAATVGRLRPAMGRQARAALAMDVLPPADDSATRARFPDLPRTPVSQVLAARVAGRPTTVS
ncbi:SDR family oxidoreductase [Actinotalea fermentans]|uniref:NAD(P)-binding domain-containing protein n=1 Tax=Actinotalea fermentans TaxID=43671 RepID=A0A511YYZ2_9CELL|nr:NAD(P)H-binding protein [Actinotalea fermentans]KGM15620.1 hypothetical protein N867_06925 [Actinotalea fermentans ATCC 43279 = JCM 9966 = DSM 3133]GEN80421.1 hypothetical protein AFE02nite_21550 [Actinotalea fermentans]